MFPVVSLSSGWRPDERRFITLMLVVACQNFHADDKGQCCGR